MNWKKLIKSLLRQKTEECPSVEGGNGVTGWDTCGKTMNTAEAVVHGAGSSSGWNKTTSSPPPKTKKRVKRLIPGALQYPDSHKGLPWQQLLIGLDFGTAFTKVVIGESRVRYAVPFGSEGGQSSICQPCILYLDGKGSGSLKPGAGASEKISNLKMSLISGDSDQLQKTYIVVFLALVLRHARTWLLTEQRQVYQGKYIDWHVNIGLPTEKFHDEEMVHIYQSMVRAAWFLSTGEDSIRLSDAADCLKMVHQGAAASVQIFEDEERGIHPDKVSCFPEFVAQVAGYVRSPRRRSDLHLLVDIGAGTVDVTIFNIHKNQDEDVFPIFAKGVKPLGAAYLLRHRFKKLNVNVEVDATLRVPDNEDFVEMYGISGEQLGLIDEDFRRAFHVLVAEQLRQVKLKRYRNSQQWAEGIPCFLCGGGRVIELYNGVLDRLQAPDFPFRISLDHLPLPDDLQGAEFSAGDFHRLLVAYGLSIDPFDIGKIIKAQDIVDDDPPEPPLSYDDLFVSKEMT